MKVKELIDILKELNQEEEIIVSYDTNCGFANITGEVYTNEDDYFKFKDEKYILETED